MPAALQTTRVRWIQAGLDALAAGGPDAVRVEALARTLGVSKGGFYGQFADRPTFLSALLDEWERRSVDEVLARVDATDADPAGRIRRAGALTFADDLLPIDLAVRGWAHTDPSVAARLRRVDDRRMAFLRSQFAAITADPADIEARSTLAFALAIGQHFMATGHAPFSRAEAFNLAAAFVVAGGAGTPGARAPADRGAGTIN